MRRSSIYSRRSAPLEVKMTPMIDVVFLLLVFFVWTASFQIVEHVLPSDVSSMSGSGEVSETPPEELDFDAIVIRVAREGDRLTWRLNNALQPNLEAIRERLAAIVQVKNDVPVIIDSEPDVPIGDVIDAFDAARLEGFQKVQMAASVETL